MDKRMQMACIAAISTAWLVMAVGVQTAQAMPKLNEAGTFDCTCKGGTGTCDFESSTDNTDCFKSVGDTCTGTCTLTLTPDKPKASILKNSIQRGTKGGVLKGTQ